MNGGANRGEALESEAGLASAQFRFDTPQLAAVSFIISPQSPKSSIAIRN